ncbi:MAG: hypothetical protein AAF211_18310 [Myxococcota bacterium]
MTRIFTDLAGLVGQVVPAWALPFVVAGLALVALPPWLESVRGKQIKGCVRRMVRADDRERAALSDRALHLAGARRLRLVGLALEAMRYDQRLLRDEALARLQQHPKGRVDAKKLRQRFEKAPVRFSDPLAAQVRVERLLDEGLVVGACEQLTAALRQFPDDPELLRLSAELEATRHSTESEPAHTPKPSGTREGVA